MAIVETWMITAGRGPVNIEDPAALAAVLHPEKVKVVIQLADAYAGDDARVVRDDIARVEVGAVWNVYRVQEPVVLRRRKRRREHDRRACHWQ